MIPKPSLVIPRRPWLLSRQYGMTFVLSQDNEIIIGASTCACLGDDVVRYIIAAVNDYSPDEVAIPGLDDEFDSCTPIDLGHGFAALVGERSVALCSEYIDGTIVMPWAVLKKLLEVLPLC